MDEYYPFTFFKLTLKKALELSANKIIELFQKFAAAAHANDANAYGVHEEARAYIQNAVTMITTIHDYKRNGGNDPSVGFIMEIPQEAGPITFGSLIVGYQGHEFELRTLYDIVAWIFSVVGNVPDQAKRETYYYPLMMIASVFCQKLISKNKTAEVWSVMWFKQTVNNRQVTRVILGANLDNPAKNLKVDTKNFRKDVLRNAQVLLWDGLPPAQTEEPSGVVVGADFGHCAETYPLLFICSAGTDEDRSKIRESAEGFAAVTKTLYDESKITITPYKIADSDGELVANPKIIPPCDNCAILISMNGLTLNNFEWSLHITRPKVR